MTDLPEIQDTDLAPAVDELVALLLLLDRLAPDWRRLELIKNGKGEAVLVIFDGSEEMLLNGSPWQDGG